MGRNEQVSRLRSVTLARHIFGISVGCLAFVACTPPGGWFRAGPRPAAIIGIWIDVEKTTASDTAEWVLAANGDDRSRQILLRPDRVGVVQREEHERKYGFWYLYGTLGDTAKQAICFKQRPRDGATCLRFRLDTLAGPPAQRRLTILGYRGAHHESARVLIERLP